MLNKYDSYFNNNYFKIDLLASSYQQTNTENDYENQYDVYQPDVQLKSIQDEQPGIIYSTVNETQLPVDASPEPDTPVPEKVGLPSPTTPQSRNFSTPITSRRRKLTPLNPPAEKSSWDEEANKCWNLNDDLNETITPASETVKIAKSEYDELKRLAAIGKLAEQMFRPEFLKSHGLE